MWPKFLGGLRPKVSSIVLQTNRFSIQSKNKCYIVSLLLQKQQLLVPCQILLTKLSFVRITPLNRNHRNIFTLSGNLILHRNMLFGIIFSFKKVLYIHLTMNCPLVVTDHLNTSSWSFKCILIILNMRLFHEWRLCPTKAFWKDILNGMEFKTFVTVEFLLLEILDRFRYCSFKVEFSSQISFQNMICVPLCNMKFHMDRNWFLIFIKPVHNWESPVSFYLSNCLCAIVSYILIFLWSTTSH
jgi:hypothetical protein